MSKPIHKKFNSSRKYKNKTYVFIPSTTSYDKNYVKKIKIRERPQQ